MLRELAQWISRGGAFGSAKEGHYGCRRRREFNYHDDKSQVQDSPVADARIEE